VTAAVLSIAGSDSSAGAGLQADLKTFSALGVYGATVVTAVTAQNTVSVSAVHCLPPDIVTAQIDAVFGDLDIHAVKVGMLGATEIVEAVAAGLENRARGVPVVLDPVMMSTTGRRLLDEGAISTLRGRLMPLAALVTPNIEEAAALLGCEPAESEDDIVSQAKRLRTLGPSAVLITGGHRAGAEASDLYYDGQTVRVYSTPRVKTRNTHGTGCTLSAAIAALLAKGLPMEGAIAEAKAYLQGALEHAEGFDIGAGRGPLPHFYRR
jgi:hydroxymethylpyrimidine/phosphomethylpyrimidine kinase